jgi:hypothetical protein
MLGFLFWGSIHDEARDRERSVVRVALPVSGRRMTSESQGRSAVRPDAAAEIQRRAGEQAGVSAVLRTGRGEGIQLPELADR